MSGAYLGDGRRKSSMTHARRGQKCDLCGFVAFGNGGAMVSHGRAHVRRDEAVELFKEYPAWPRLLSPRLFLAPDDERIPHYLALGFIEITR